jgi:hypothetical protein
MFSSFIEAEWAPFDRLRAHWLRILQAHCLGRLQGALAPETSVEER